MSTVEVGSEIAGLRIDELAARGGSSDVFRATDIASGAKRAVKVLHNPEPSAKQRLVREADLLSRLDHPALVRFHGLHVVGDSVVLITEWIDGEPLARYLQYRKPSHDEALAILHELAAPLDYLHANGIVHRDISGSNIIRSLDGSLTLIDLGIGHDVGSATLTNHDLVAGTPRYLAPEIIRGESATAQSDQYSLAMLFYELLAGHSAFPSSPEVATALHHHMHTVPAPLDEVDPTMPSGTAAAVARALAKDPVTRFASVGEFAAAAHNPQTQRVIAPAAQPAHRRSLVLAAAAAVAVGAIVLIAMAVIFLRSDSDSASNSVSVGGEAATTTDGAADAAADSADDVADSADGVADAAADSADGVADSADDVADSAVAPTEAPASTATDSAAEPDQVTSTAVGWADGRAAELECNLLAGSDFATGSVPLDFFGDPPGRERVVDQGGFADSWALEVGIENDFGQYAEAVPIEPGQSYWFRGWFDSDGPIAAAEMGISLLRADYSGNDVTIKMPLDLTAAGFHEARIDQIPADAAFALPYLFKDASPGTLLADELVFGATDMCFAEISQLGD